MMQTLTSQPHQPQLQDAMIGTVASSSDSLSRLPKDWLVHITRFLSLHELLNTFGTCCRTCHDSLNSVPSREESRHIKHCRQRESYWDMGVLKTKSTLNAFLKSLHRRHITVLQCGFSSVPDTREFYYEPDLRQALQSLTHLKELHKFTIICGPKYPCPSLPFLGLEVLHLKLNYDETRSFGGEDRFNWSLVHDLILTLRHMPSLTDLSLDFKTPPHSHTLSHHPPLDLFEGLPTTLIVFRLVWVTGMEDRYRVLSPQTLQTIRSLPHLTNFDLCSPLSDSQLGVLTTPADIALPLQQLGQTVYRYNALDYLIHLKSLTSLGLDFISSEPPMFTDFTRLGEFHSLAELTLYLTDTTTYELISAGLLACASTLTHLVIMDGAISSLQFKSILTFLKRLQRLELYQDVNPHFQSLDFLLVDQPREDYDLIDVNVCALLNPSLVTLEEFIGWTKLEAIVLAKIPHNLPHFSDRLAQLTPGSSTFRTDLYPHLTSFIYAMCSEHIPPSEPNGFTNNNRFDDDDDHDDPSIEPITSTSTTPTPMETDVSISSTTAAAPDPPEDLTKEGIEPNPGPFVNPTTSVTPQTLFNDGLHTIYSYLTLHDWLSSMYTCHHWYSAGCSQPNCQFTINSTGRPSSQVVAARISTVSLPDFKLHSHFSRFILDGLADGITGDQCFRLIQPFTHLRLINARLLDDVSNLEMCQWPIHLIDLSILLSHVPFTHLFESLIQQLSHQLESLCMGSLEPIHLTTFGSRLHQFKRLTSLTLRSVYAMNAPLFHVNRDFWSHLPISLTYLNARDCLGNQPLYLTKDLAPPLPHLTHLTLGFMHRLKVDELQSILAVAPNLEELAPTRPFHLQHLSEFRFFQSLHTIVFYHQPTNYPIDSGMSLLITHLSQCHRLTCLKFDEWITFTREEWFQLSESVPGLIELELSFISDEILSTLNQSLSPDTFVNLVHLTVIDNYSIELKETLNNRLICPKLLAFTLGRMDEKFFEFDVRSGINIECYRLDQPVNEPDSSGIPDTPPVTSSIETATVSTVSDTTIPSIPLNPIPALFNHGLYLIFSYLNKLDWVAAMNTCRHWSQIGPSAPSRRMLLYSERNAPCRFMPHHGLARHFTRTVFYLFDSSELIALLSHLTYLEQMRLVVDSHDFADLSVTLPSHLRTMWISLKRLHLPQLVSSVRTISTTLTSLTIDDFPITYSFNPEFGQTLTSLCSLTYLKFTQDRFGRIGLSDVVESDFIVDCQLTALPPSLTSLNLFRGRNTIIRSLHLLSPVPSLTEFDLNDMCNREPDSSNDMLRLVHQFAPNLIRLEPTYVHSTDLADHLSLFKHLQTFEICQLEWGVEGLNHSRLFGSCPSLTSILLRRHVPRTLFEWEEFGRRMHPRLRRLNISLETSEECELGLVGLRSFPQLEWITIGGDMNSDHLERFKNFFANSTTFPQLTYLMIRTDEHGSFEYDLERGIHPEFRLKKVLSPAQALFMDGVLSIFSWLRLSDLLPALHSCHYWYSCGAKERSRQVVVDCEWWSTLISSPLRAHVGSLMCFDDMSTIHHVKHMTHLRVLHCLLEKPTQLNEPIYTTFTLPKSLVTLKLVLIKRCQSVSLVCQSLLDRLPTAAPQLIHLELCYSYPSMRPSMRSNATTIENDQPPYHFDLSTLLQLHDLRILRLELPYTLTITDQQILSNLPLMTILSNGGDFTCRPDWTIFHHESPFMKSIQEWDWSEWLPNEHDWQHLIQHPPPQLRTLTLTYHPISTVDLSAFHLTKLNISTSHDYFNAVEPRFYDHVLIACQSLTSLNLFDSRLKDDELCVILTLLKLDELEISCPGSSIFLESWKHLPRRTIIHCLSFKTFELFTSNLTQATQLQILHIKYLSILDDVIFNTESNHQLTKIDHFCRSNQMARMEQINITAINYRRVDFRYIKHLPTSHNGS